MTKMECWKHRIVIRYYRIISNGYYYLAVASKNIYKVTKFKWAAKMNRYCVSKGEAILYDALDMAVNAIADLGKMLKRETGE